MNLYDELPLKVEYEGKTYKILPYFNRVLFCLDTFKSKEYSQFEKVDICFSVLFEYKGRLFYTTKTKLLSIAFDLLFSTQKKGSNKKYFDFKQDSKYIYSGFMQAYGIDLFECKNKLHWWKFNALFIGLPKDTKIMEIIDIRAKPIPQRTKFNGNYIANLIKLKAEYQLELTQEEREKEMQEALGNLFHKLKGMAKEKR